MSKPLNILKTAEYCGLRSIVCLRAGIGMRWEAVKLLLPHFMIVGEGDWVTILLQDGEDKWDLSLLGWPCEPAHPS